MTKIAIRHVEATDAEAVRAIFQSPHLVRAYLARGEEPVR